MATVKYEEELLKGTRWSHGCTLVQWLGITENDVGQEYEFPGAADCSVQFAGTFGGGSIDLQGSNIPGGSDYLTLLDLEGNSIQASGANIFTIRENVRFVRPKQPAGASGASINVYVLAKAVR